MGASNALAALRLYAGKVPPTSLNLLVYMALVAADRDDAPSWWEGHEMLAIRALGYPEPVGRAGKGAVERAITPLFRAGAITTTRHASGNQHGRLVTVRYRLWITEPAPHGNRGKPRGEHPTETVGSQARHPTVSVTAPHGNRVTKEEEEDLKQERELKAGIQTSVDSTRTGSAREAEEAERKRQIDRLAEWGNRQQARRVMCPRCSGGPFVVMSNGYLKNHGLVDPRTGVSACHRVEAPAAMAS